MGPAYQSTKIYWIICLCLEDGEMVLGEAEGEEKKRKSYRAETDDVKLMQLLLNTSWVEPVISSHWAVAAPPKEEKSLLINEDRNAKLNINRNMQIRSKKR